MIQKSFIFRIVKLNWYVNPAHHLNYDSCWCYSNVMIELNLLTKEEKSCYFSKTEIHQKEIDLKATV